MKNFFRAIVIKVLWGQVSRLRKKHNPKVIGVAGSVGKTSTKIAVAKVLSEKYQVAWQEGNYNDVVSIPLVFFNRKMPSLMNPFAWLLLFIKNEIKIFGKYPYSVVALELGTDHAGDMAQLRGRLTTDITLLTAITAEHLESFVDMDDVAKDELVAAELAGEVIVDIDSVPSKYLKDLTSAISVGTKGADCTIATGKLTKSGRAVSFKYDGYGISIETPLIGRQNLPALAFAFIVGIKLGLNEAQLKNGLKKIRPYSGRMNVLGGKNSSVLIDDTYNSSPHAAIAALETLYEIDAKQKIAVLGQMNELGKFSKELHEEVGGRCNPEELDLILTIGKDANEYLASSAETKGCKVKRCESPYEVAKVIEPILNNDTVVLLKGSQNGGFLEEAVRLLLKDSEDNSKLVRQSSKWAKIKQEQFKDVL